MRLDYKTHAIIGLVVLTIASWLAYLVLEPPPIISSKRVVLTEKVPRGGILTIETTWKFSSACGFYLFREITDSSGTIIFSESDRRFPEQQPDGVAITRFVTVPISPFAELGPATYQTYFSWGCNFIQELFPMAIRKGEPLKFEIVEKEEP